MKRLRDDRGRFARRTGEDATAAPVNQRQALTRGHAGGAGASGAGRGGARPRKAKTALSKKEKLTIFFRELSILCNVTSALRKAGLRNQSSAVYESLGTDPAFRARWDAAICRSYALLELEVLERRYGDARPEPANEVERRLRGITTPQALQLLKLHKSRGGTGAIVQASTAPRMSRQRARQIRVDLDRMLSDFNRRMGGEG